MTPPRIMKCATALILAAAFATMSHAAIGPATIWTSATRLHLALLRRCSWRAQLQVSHLDYLADPRSARRRRIAASLDDVPLTWPVPR